MLLRTFGGLALEGAEFTRPKPLLLLCYLALEGPQSRRRLARLFWPDARDHMKSLTVALSRLRKGAPGAVEADHDRAWALIPSDAERFLALLDEGDGAAAVGMYAGPFLDGFYLQGWGPELEGWVFETREFLAAHARRALLDLAAADARQQRFANAAANAERALAVGETPPEPEVLQTMHALLVAGDSARAAEVRREAEEFGLDLCTTADEARRRLAGVDADRSAAPPNNLPARTAPFIGRDLELTELGSLLRRGGERLVTLTGPPGVGKSRLALEAARERVALGAFAGGVYFVSLESLASPRLVPSAIAEAMGIMTRGEGAASARVADAIRDRETLLVLDNFEHLTDAAGVVSDLLSACGRLAVLVASRERLNLEEERIFPLEGLPYPKSDDVGVDEAMRFDAVRLYVQHARRANPAFVLDEQTLPGTLATARRMEGLPLGLELAAGWLRILPAGELADEIGRNPDVLVARNRNVPERHRSLWDAFEHSWALLDDRERAVLRQLSVFRGGFRRQAARVVADATIPVLASLVEKSLLRVDRNGRYDRHPLVYQYTQDRAAARPTELAAARARHGRHWIDFLVRLEDDLVGDAQSEAIAAIEEDLENVHAAWAWAADEARHDLLDAGCRPLQLFYIQRGGMADAGARAFAEAADGLDAGEASHHVALGRLRSAEAWFRFLLGELDRSAAAAGEGLRLLEPHLASRGSVREEGAAARVARAVTSARNTLGNVTRRRGDFAAAQEHFEAAMDVARRFENEPQIAILTNNLASLMTDLGRYRESERLYREAIARNRILGNHRSAVRNLTNLGSTLVRAGDSDAAERVLREALALAQEIGYDQIVPNVLLNLGGAAYVAGRHAEARDLYAESLDRKGDGDPRFAADVQQMIGRAAAALGDLRAARRSYRASLEAARPDGDRRIVAEALIGLSELYAADGDAARAAGILCLAGDGEGLTLESVQRKRALERELERKVPASQLRRERAQNGERSPESVVREALRRIAAP